MSFRVVHTKNGVDLVRASRLGEKDVIVLTAAIPTPMSTTKVSNYDWRMVVTCSTVCVSFKLPGKCEWAFSLEDIKMGRAILDPQVAIANITTMLIAVAFAMFALGFMFATFMISKAPALSPLHAVWTWLYTTADQTVMDVCRARVQF